jgi:alpha-L-arabinofuranosidase
VFRTYSNRDAAKLIDTDVKIDQYDVDEGVRRIPTIHGVPYLDIVSTLNDAGDVLTLFCVNRDLSRDISSTVRLAGFATRSGRSWQITAGSIYEANDEVRPEAIVPVEASFTVSGPTFEHTFPRSSVTVIELRRTTR